MKGIAAVVADRGVIRLFWLSTNFSMMGSSPVRGYGFELGFGGYFATVPTAVLSSVRRKPPVHRTGTASASDSAGAPSSTGHDGVAHSFHPGHHLVDTWGGETPKVQRIDLFGLGIDFAVYNKVIWGNPDQADLAPWYNLGGTFTSSPTAIAGQGDRVDVFAVGLDHAMYAKTRIGENWTPDWEKLGGAFTSAASAISRGDIPVEIYARGADFKLRRNHIEGSAWFGWQNLGGDLASAPVAVSWGPDRVDIFAVFRDGSLVHKWWDGMIWNEWESLGRGFRGEPAAVSLGPGLLDVFGISAKDSRLHYVKFRDNTWSNPAQLDSELVSGSPTVLRTASDTLELFAPSGWQLRRRWWNGDNVSVGSTGYKIRIPSQFGIAIQNIRVITSRALNSDNDAASFTLTLGNYPPDIRTQWLGVLGGTHTSEAETNHLASGGFEVDPAEAMSFGYLVVNNGHAAEEKILAALSEAGNSLALAATSSTTTDIEKGVLKFLSVKLVDTFLTVDIPIIGSVLGKIEKWILGKGIDFLFESCDGIVAAELRAMMGRDLIVLTENGKKRITVTTRHHGTDSPGICGSNSVYDVTWTIGS